MSDKAQKQVTAKTAWETFNTDVCLIIMLAGVIASEVCHAVVCDVEVEFFQIQSQI